jgi:hypothetical protein
LNEKAARGGCRVQLFFFTVSYFSRLEIRLCNDFQMEIAFVYRGLAILRVRGGLTREFWVVFEENSFGVG